MNYTPLRLHLIAVMLADPDGEWSVNAMCESLSAKVDAPAYAVHEAFLLLLNECLAEVVPYQRALTIRIRTDRNARQLLSKAFKGWCEQHPLFPHEPQLSDVDEGRRPVNRDYFLAPRV